MGYSLVEYNTLKEGIKTAVSLTLNKHGATCVAELKERRLDVEIILKTMEILDRLPDIGVEKKGIDNNGEDAFLKRNAFVNRELILNAMCIHIRERIEKTYEGSRTTSKENSIFFMKLGEALLLVDSHGKGDMPERYPTPRNRKQLMGALYEFMSANVYVNSDADDGYLPAEEQPYATIKSFETCTFVSGLLQKLQGCEMGSVVNCDKRELEKQKESVANNKKTEIKERKGYLPSLWSAAKTEEKSKDSQASLSLL